MQVQYFFKMYLWGQRIRGSGPLYIRAQGLSQGEPLPRTHNKIPEEAEGYYRGQPHAQHLTKRLKKRGNLVQGQDKGESCQHRNTEPCI